VNSAFHGFRRTARGKAPPPTFLLLALLAFWGCTNATLGSARQEIAQHRYEEAHGLLLAALNKPGALSPAERREVLDGLCLTEVRIGPPAYPLAEQRWRCSVANAYPGSPESQALAEVNDRIAAVDEREMEEALAGGNLADALTSAVQYTSVDGANGPRMAHWREGIWLIVAEQDKKLSAQWKRHRTSTLTHLAPHYMSVVPLDQHGFQRWISAETTVDGEPLFSAINVHGATARLEFPQRSQTAVRLNLSGLDHVNDALSVRCRCAGRTNVVNADTGLPAYLVRIAPAEAHSEVLIMPQ
jgi:hypothetical protein